MEGTIAVDVVAKGASPVLAVPNRCRIWGIDWQTTGTVGTVEIRDGSGTAAKKIELAGLPINSSDIEQVNGVLCLVGAYVTYTNMTNLILHIN